MFVYIYIYIHIYTYTYTKFFLAPTPLGERRARPEPRAAASGRRAAPAIIGGDQRAVWQRVEQNVV